MSSTTTDSSPVVIVSECTVFPDQKSTIGDLKLSVSDLPMLSCHYIQKGCLFPNNINNLVSSLKLGLSRALSHFPPLAGRLRTDQTGHVYISCNDHGAGFVHAASDHLKIVDVLSPPHVPVATVGSFFAMDGVVSYAGHSRPILTVQVTELADGIFIGCSVNHAVVDGTSLWDFFNTFSEACRFGGSDRRFSKVPDFSRRSVLISPAVLGVPEGGPKVTFDVSEPLAEQIFSFSREQMLKLKSKTNYKEEEYEVDIVINNNIDHVAELQGKLSNDPYASNGKLTQSTGTTTMISSFQSLCALLWRAVTRARKLPSSKTTTFRMAVNCRHRVEPELDARYFGNAIQSVPTHAVAGEVVTRGLRWCAERLNRSVVAHDDAAVRKVVGEWEANPRCFPLGNFDGAMLTMGSSPRFPMYENDFGWGRPMAIRSGRANKFDGKISAFPGREGGGSVDLEVVLSPETMAGIEADPEFMQFVSS